MGRVQRPAVLARSERFGVVFLQLRLNGVLRSWSYGVAGRKALVISSPFGGGTRPLVVLKYQPRIHCKEGGDDCGASGSSAECGFLGGRGPSCGVVGFARCTGRQCHPDGGGRGKFGCPSMVRVP